MKDKPAARRPANVRQLEGTVIALAAALRGLIKSHPDPEAARAAVEAQLEPLLAVALGKSISEETLAGLQRGRALVLHAKNAPPPGT